MRLLFLLFTAAFWLGVAGFWGAALWLPSEPSDAAGGPGVYTLSDVAKHHTAEDCWMAINGVVYDLTGYLPRHPTSPDVIVPWCGKEASDAYNTKNRGRPHSTYASELLEKYRIGVLGSAAAPK